jgi:methionine-rich copper-binding protein CopC
MKNITSFFVGVALCGASVLPASAHAFLDHAIPAVGSAAGAPGEVKLWFTEAVEPAFSSIVVRDAAGAEVDRRDTRAEGKDGTVLAVSLPPLPPGAYQVSWRVVARDTHKTQGTFPFTVRK